MSEYADISPLTTAVPDLLNISNIDGVQFANKNSGDITSADVLKLSQLINYALCRPHSNYTGVVVTHGTDTLEETVSIPISPAFSLAPIFPLLTCHPNLTNPPLTPPPGIHARHNPLLLRPHRHRRRHAALHRHLCRRPRKPARSRHRCH